MPIHMFGWKFSSFSNILERESFLMIFRSTTLKCSLLSTFIWSLTCEVISKSMPMRRAFNLDHENTYQGRLITRVKKQRATNKNSFNLIPKSVAIQDEIRRRTKFANGKMGNHFATPCFTIFWMLTCFY